MQLSEYLRHDGLSLAELIRNRQVKPSEALEAAITQVEKVNASLNAVVHKMYARARKKAIEMDRKAEKGGELPMYFGVPLLVKDLMLEIEGEPMTGSSLLLKDYISPENSELMNRYEAAGFNVFGKTNTPELGIMGVTESKFRGPCRNPWNTEHTTGGSSGGSGAAVASGMVPIAHGNDGGGSIRIPGSCNGVIGLKPTRQRMPIAPQSSESWYGLVVEHVLTRTVRDSAALLDLTHGLDREGHALPPPPEKGFLKSTENGFQKLKIGYVTGSLMGRKTHPHCLEALDSTMKKLSELGHEVREIHIPLNKSEMRLIYLLAMTHCMGLSFPRYAKLHGKTLVEKHFERETWFLYRLGSNLPESEVRWFQQGLQWVREYVPTLFEKLDLIALPTLAYPPSKIGLMDLNIVEDLAVKAVAASGIYPLQKAVLNIMALRGIEASPNTQLFNISGHPAISLPFHVSPEGLPIGIQFVAPYGLEERLLTFAAHCEKTLGWPLLPFQRSSSLD